MRKKKKLELIDNFIQSYRLLIICMNAATQQNCPHAECEKLLHLQISTTALIADYEKIIKKLGFDDESFVNLKKELNECVQNHHKLSPNFNLDSKSIESSLQILKNTYLNYLQEIPALHN